MDQQNKLIASNTIVTYSRTILNVFLSLYSTRWVLQELGENDFGLYSLVGSLLIVLVFLSEKIINGVSRFYAYEIGRSADIQSKPGTICRFNITSAVK